MVFHVAELLFMLDTCQANLQGAITRALLTNRIEVEGVFHLVQLLLMLDSGNVPN